ncbi:hypothetical protein O6P43_006058 [Quillaja saponaria]|uniref:Uncharacterized protein n=1 Tax=Quillaja saponaria TaxID=32244 RepID=A0AAD7VHP0_QUISA|nr:hypothetical protein O6P43_006058 [Quillaja saponaria]
MPSISSVAHQEAPSAESSLFFNLTQDGHLSCVSARNFLQKLTFSMILKPNNFAIPRNHIEPCSLWLCLCPFLVIFVISTLNFIIPIRNSL